MVLTGQSRRLKLDGHVSNWKVPIERNPGGSSPVFSLIVPEIHLKDRPFSPFGTVHFIPDSIFAYIFFSNSRN